jgi:hypothetical protein
MTNLQLLLTIGIPSLLVVLSWMSNSARMAAHDKRFDDMERKFVEVDRRFGEMDRKIDALIIAQHRDTLEILRNMTSLHERVAVVEAKAA